MGNSCCSLPFQDTSKRLIALKLPHGSKGIAWTTRRFEPVDINTWLEKLYANSSWTGYVCYNDELPESHHTTRGHCNGILTWNDKRIGWLIHSVPKFPRTFTGSTISPIDSSELLYGQSFLYVEQSRAAVPLDSVLRQILWLKPNFFHTHNMPSIAPYTPKPLEIKQLRWSKTMVHLAKAPDHATDYIGTELCKQSPGPWQEESWKRGSEYTANSNLVSIQRLSFQNTPYTSSQDHSKWAITANATWIGDLNHMRSQEKRGGGGMVITDKGLAAAFQSLIVV